VEKTIKVFKLSKRLVGLVIGLIIALLLLCILCLNLWYKNKIQGYQLYTYAAVNHVPVKIQEKSLLEIKKFAYKYKVPENLILAISEQEQGLFLHEYGCQKIEKYIM